MKYMRGIFASAKTNRQFLMIVRYSNQETER